MFSNGDRVKVKDDPTETIWVIQQIKNGYAFCIEADYHSLRPATFAVEQLIKVEE